MDVKIVFLTLHRQEDFFHAAMDLGVLGYILKDSVTYEIVNGIKSVAEGQFYVSSGSNQFLIQKRTAQNFARTKSFHQITSATERRVLQMVGDYKSNKEIADELFIHFSHRRNSSDKHYKKT